MALKDSLDSITIGFRSVTEYLTDVKAKFDEIGLLDRPLHLDDVTLYVLNGLGSQYQDIASSIRLRERPLTFPELHAALVTH